MADDLTYSQRTPLRVRVWHPFGPDAGDDVTFLLIRGEIVDGQGAYAYCSMLQLATQTPQTAWTLFENLFDSLDLYHASGRCHHD